MPLLEKLTLTLAPAIAKALLKIWFKGDPLAEGIGVGLVDFLKTKTDDIRAQQRGKRQLEEIGELIAESLLPVIKREFSQLDEGGSEAVVLALTETLNATRLTPQLFSERNLDPIKLSRYLCETRSNIVRDFSADEISLYHRLIDIVSQRIIDISAQLPSFIVHPLGEILKRQEQPLEVAERILAEAHRIREGSIRRNKDTIERARFEESYRHAVIRNLDALELFGVDAAASSRRYRLSVAYVTLSAAHQLESDSIIRQGELHRTNVPVDEVLAQTRRLFLLIFRVAKGPGLSCR
jgi:hypothetical protein